MDEVLCHYEKLPETIVTRQPFPVLYEEDCHKTSKQHWMEQPDRPGDCPLGLEYLIPLDQLHCHQIPDAALRIEPLSNCEPTPSNALLNSIAGRDVSNKYIVKNSLGQTIFCAFEEETTDSCARFCHGSQRAFTLSVVNNYSEEVMRFIRPRRAFGGCCWCADCCAGCAQALVVEAPRGTVIGRVKQTGAACTSNFDIVDENGLDVQCCIKGPLCTCSACGGDVHFPVYADELQVGNVTKKWGGCAKECFTYADDFQVSFPFNFDAKTKATLLGAMFLINFMCFEPGPRC